MRKSLLALVAAVLLAACSDPSPTSTTTGAQAAFNDADVRFLQAMIPHHQQAIDAAKLVRSRDRSRPAGQAHRRDQRQSSRDPDHEGLAAALAAADAGHRSEGA
jgi:uncharacterized protein (DUF305 family)